MMANVKSKSPRVARTASPAPAGACAYCRDLDRWPRSWMGREEDLPPGEGLVQCFRPFIEYLASAGFSAQTVRRHVDNLWSLGGEIIRDLHYDPTLRKRPGERLLREAIHQDGGPLLHNGSQDQQRSLDATCRKLHRFLAQSNR